MLVHSPRVFRAGHELVTEQLHRVENLPRGQLGKVAIPTVNAVVHRC